MLVLYLGPLQAQILLNVTWNPSSSHLAFTSTGASPSTDVTVGAYADGITLRNFLSPGFTFEGILLPEGSIVSTIFSDSSGSPFLNRLYTEQFTTLGFYLSPDPMAPVTLDFNTADPAFTGSAVFDLTGEATFSSFFRADGTTGALYAGFSGTAGEPTLIGSWQFNVVPEPSTYALFAGLGILGFVVWRRRAQR
jgi:hypothetical protein